MDLDAESQKASIPPQLHIACRVLCLEWGSIPRANDPLHSKTRLLVTQAPQTPVQQGASALTEQDHSLIT